MTARRAAEARSCGFCGTGLVQGRRETQKLFSERRFCSWTCRHRDGEAHRMGYEREARNWAELQGGLMPRGYSFSFPVRKLSDVGVAPPPSRQCGFCKYDLARQSNEAELAFAERVFCDARCATHAALEAARAEEAERPKPQNAPQARQQRPSVNGAHPKARNRPAGRTGATERQSLSYSEVPVTAKPLPIGDWRLDMYIGFEARSTRKAPRTAERAKVLAAQGDVCLYCEIPIGTTVIRTRPSAQRRKSGSGGVALRRNWDHFVPYAYAARNDGTNWVIACHVCNGIKSSRMFGTVAEARELILPRRVAKGYEDVRAVLARLALDEARQSRRP